MPSQIIQGKKLIEPVIVSDDEDTEEAFLIGFTYSGVLHRDINPVTECYLNLLEIPSPAENPQGYALHMQTATAR